MRVLLLSTAAILALSSSVTAQFGNADKARRFSDLASVKASVTPATAKPGSVVTLKLTVTIDLSAHTYPTNPTTEQTSRNKIFTPKSPLLIDVGLPADPAGVEEKFNAQEGKVTQSYDGQATWEWKAVVAPNAAAGKVKLGFGNLHVMVCNSNNCFNASEKDLGAVDFEVLPGPAVPVPPEYQALVDKAMGGGVKPTPPSQPPEAEKAKKGLIRKEAKALKDYQADLEAVAASLVRDEGSRSTVAGSGLGALLAAAIFWGFVSLVTPCVFPMIPITVSLFLKQSHQSTAGAMKFAFVYCLTIVVVLGLAAVFMLGIFQELSVTPGMNIFLGALLIAFALSLFGMYDIQLPGFLLRATEKRRAAGGLVGTVFGALAFSIVSFTCVAPFLGGFAGLAATGNYSQVELILAGLTFAAAFASPFFILAMFPSLLRKLPRSGGWLDTVKAVMGFLELAAAFKFFRSAEIRWPPVEYFTYDVVLGSWVAISIVCGLYLLGVFKLPHDGDTPHLGVPRLIFAMAFLGFGVYLMPGLLKGADGRNHRPGGRPFAWVEAFLLPDVGDDLNWSFDLRAELEAARKEKKRVFVDFTGVICTNCRYNENSVFTIPAIREAMSRHKLVQLYTDDMPLEAYQTPPDADVRKGEAVANGDFQDVQFGSRQLPYYVLLEPLPGGKVRVVGVYPEGMINDKAAFLKFLQQR